MTDMQPTDMQLPGEDYSQDGPQADSAPAQANDPTPKGWLKVNEDGTESLVKGFTFDDFAGALAFANQVGQVAERLNHHPVLTISYGKVQVATTTHDAGGLTPKDTELVESIEGLVPPAA